jgi:hypothetical protein
MADLEVARDAHDRRAAIWLRRSVNDAAAELAARFDAGDGIPFEFLCECGDPRCSRMVEMTVDDYRLHEPGSVVGHR